MRSVPSKTIGQVLGITDGGDEEPEDEIDQRIKSESTIPPPTPNQILLRKLTKISVFIELLKRRRANALDVDASSSSESETDTPAFSVPDVPDVKVATFPAVVAHPVSPNYNVTVKGEKQHRKRPMRWKMILVGCWGKRRGVSSKWSPG